MLQRSWTDDLLGAASGPLGGQNEEGAPQGHNPVEIPEMEVPIPQPGGGSSSGGGGPIVMPEMEVPVPQPGGGTPVGGPVVLPEMEVPAEGSGGALWNQTAGAASEWFSSLW